MSAPWMPLYVADYLADTRRLSTLEHGAYILLIMDYWRNGGLPTDEERLARIAGLDLAQWQCVRIAIAPLFLSGWRHKRIDAELRKSGDRRSKAQESASKRWKDKIKPIHAKAHAKAMPTQCEGNANAMLSQPQPEESSLRSLSAREIDALADEFYRAYPKHVDPADAKAKFIRTVKGGVDPHKLIDRAKRFADACQAARTEKQFIKAPAVWLNKGCYDDEDLPTPPARAGPNGGRNGSRGKTSAYLDAIEASQRDADAGVAVILPRIV